MLRMAKGLLGFTLGARDGQIGKVRDFYFDDDRWAVRYVVADTGHWFPGRKVLLSPFAFGGVDHEARSIAVSLTRKQIEDSPPIDEHKPVSRQYEMDYNEYYGWPAYWVGPSLWGITPFPVMATPQDLGLETEAFRREREALRREENPVDARLRSAQEVRGYRLHAADGHLGDVEDFLLDLGNWSIAALLADTGRWLPGKKLLLPPEAIRSLDWGERSAELNFARADLREAPAVDPDHGIGAEDLERARAHFAHAHAGH